MSSQRPSKSHRIAQVAASFRRKLFHPSDSPTPSSMDVDSSSDSYMATTYAGTSDFPSSMASMVGVDHPPASAAVTSREVHGISRISPRISVPVSRSGIAGLETLPTVSNDFTSATIVPNIHP
ncbi:hypothetical protein BYT27DRAFT_7210531 [Phlegmacium glaucopus]|nr:hypothetical protein BYT27DRAFT_7210531 [Phlegmacium glaucopus]